VTKRDTLENQVNSIYLAIGSNLGNKKNNIEKAKFILSQNNVMILKSSSFYESPSWPNPTFPKFLNIVLKINTNLKPLKLLDLCKKIESQLGRKKTSRNSPRVCDIDILDYNKKVMKNGLVLPHPRLHTRNFVILPLFEISKDWSHPILKYSIKRLLTSLSNRDIRSIKQI
tara:strand:- start:147 stop:659 length:513 start_codon:yes stop_codon:yes gene_type:complete